jgi:hypothetical protein
MVQATDLREGNDPAGGWRVYRAYLGAIFGKCGIRGKAASDSDGRRPPNPIQSGHLFRSKAATLLMG